jgi:hypothetical protein
VSLSQNIAAARVIVAIVFGISSNRRTRKALDTEKDLANKASQWSDAAARIDR